MSRPKLLLFAALLMLVSLLQFAPTSAQTPDSAVSKIAFVTGDPHDKASTITVADPDGSHPIPFVTGEFFYNPIWSPDGTKLAFMAGDDKNGSIEWNAFVINSDGTNLHKISSHKAHDGYQGQIAWSPDSQQLIYAMRTSFQGFYKVNADGSGEERLRFAGLTKDFIEGFIAWSPDGSQIAVNLQSDTLSNGQLSIANADSTNLEPFVLKNNDGLLDSYSRLEWSPDGKRVLLYALQFSTSAPEEIAVADADGSNFKAVVKPPPNLLSTAIWSPDSQQILFIANEPGVDFEPGKALWLVNADGTHDHVLNTNHVYIQDVGITWGMIPSSITLPSAPVAMPAS